MIPKFLRTLAWLPKWHFMAVCTIVFGTVVAATLFFNLRRDGLPLDIEAILAIAILCLGGGAIWSWLMWYAFLKPAQVRAATPTRAHDGTQEQGEMPNERVEIPGLGVSGSVMGALYFLCGSTIRLAATLVACVAPAVAIVVLAGWSGRSPAMVGALSLIIGCALLVVTSVALRSQGKGDTVLEFGKDTLRVVQNTRYQATYSWQGIDRINETTRFVLVSHLGILILMISKCDMEPSDLTRLRDLLRAHAHEVQT